jgi:hypothetical protein
MRGFVPTREHDWPTRGLLLGHGAAHPTPSPAGRLGATPTPALTKVTVPSSAEGSGLHGPFLPYSGRTSTGSWTAPGGAARPEDRALQRQAQRGATEAPCGLPGPPEEGLYYHFSGRIRLLSSMLAGYVATPERWLELFGPNCHPGHFAPGERFLTSGASERWMALSPRARGSLSPLSVPVAARFLLHCRHRRRARAGGLPRSVSGALDPRSTRGGGRSIWR